MMMGKDDYVNGRWHVRFHLPTTGKTKALPAQSHPWTVEALCFAELGTTAWLAQQDHSSRSHCSLTGIQWHEGLSDFSLYSSLRIWSPAGKSMLLFIVLYGTYLFKDSVAMFTTVVTINSLLDRRPFFSRSSLCWCCRVLCEGCSVSGRGLAVDYCFKPWFGFILHSVHLSPH